MEQSAHLHPGVASVYEFLALKAVLHLEAESLWIIHRDIRLFRASLGEEAWERPLLRWQSAGSANQAGCGPGGKLSYNMHSSACPSFAKKKKKKTTLFLKSIHCGVNLT